VTPAASVTGSIGETAYSMPLTDRPQHRGDDNADGRPDGGESECLAEDETEDPARGAAAARGGKQDQFRYTLGCRRVSEVIADRSSGSPIGRSKAHFHGRSPR
jgi:hypothetical protein